MKNKESSHSVIYGVIGMLGILLCGVAIGFIINGVSRSNNSLMTVAQCQKISNQIINAADNNNPDLLRQLNEIYSENCTDRTFKKFKPKFMQNKKNAPIKEQNPSKRQERDLFGAPTQLKKPERPVCERIEAVWLKRLNEINFEYSDDAQDYINRAKVYATLADKGCEQNVSVYKELASKDLEIARALNQDRLDDKREATEMVETYKRLQMQNEAAKMIEKAKKLTNPAIDFIIQLEKIIEE